ncbi:E3 ubiquitin-protein ligase RSL1 [Lactuca sativa]|uniref:RBR-type E3 ubiquitin transferase n=1 Tax=Lactuca sativa TaxID=4236 RepID=A0A9R1V7Y3_LACSA|nr:E3 ubiquitin-protein ligase RSL1 [Lactuca sativa]KAJ0199830.1 hypothetical protein LSAT_V11C600308190 [Lactuca sativa]
MDVDDDNELLILLSDSDERGSDLDLAFQLQMQEAIKVSSSSKPSSSSSSYFPLNETQESSSGTARNSVKRERERYYRELVGAELKNMNENLNRLIHDQPFARQILDVPDVDLTMTGDFLEKPYALLPSSNEEVFTVYFRGLVCDESVINVKMSFAGIGVAIYDESDCCVFESRKSFLVGGTEGEDDDVLELTALIEALNTAVTLGLKRVEISCNCLSIYHYLIGERRPTDNKVMTLINHLNHMETKFAYCCPILVKQNNLAFAYQLAKDAILSHATKLAENESRKTLLEQCTICFESTYIGQMFSVNKCLHRYCFSCMRKHVEAKLHQGKLPECPHEECKSELEIETCKSFLNPKLYDMMSSMIKEASIPPSEKVYCPVSSCSALMSKTELQQQAPPSSSSSSSSSQESGKRKCVKCHRLFCMNCNVAWHDNMSCCDYIESFEYKSANEAKLKSLASSKNWRQCVKCKNLVELAAGCFHICCRCGYEFCYTCGAEWIEKKPTCTCPIWDESYIIYVE